MYKPVAAAEVSQYVHNTLWGEYHTRITDMVALAARRKVPTRELSMAMSANHFGSPVVQNEIKSLVGHCYQFAVEKELFLRFDPSRITDSGVYHGYDENSTKEEALAAVKANIAQSPGGFYLYLRDRVVVPKLSDMRKCRASACKGDLAVFEEEDGKVIQGNKVVIDQVIDERVSVRIKSAPITTLEEIPDIEDRQARSKISVLKRRGLEDELEFLQLEKHLDINKEQYEKAKEDQDLKTLSAISSQRAKAREAVRARLLAALSTVEVFEEMAY